MCCQQTVRFQEPIFQKYLINAGNLTRGLVSCTGAQFCGVAMIETKNRAMAIVEKLEAQLDLPKKVRMHWTGCPNSCGQVSMRLWRAWHPGFAIYAIHCIGASASGVGVWSLTSIHRAVSCYDRQCASPLFQVHLIRCG